MNVTCGNFPHDLYTLWFCSLFCVWLKPFSTSQCISQFAIFVQTNEQKKIKKRRWKQTNFYRLVHKMLDYHKRSRLLHSLTHCYTYEIRENGKMHLFSAFFHGRETETSKYMAISAEHGEIESMHAIRLWIRVDSWKMFPLLSLM